MPAEGLSMGEPWQTMLRVAIGIGIAVFMWSVAASLEKIATALSRLADTADARRERTEEKPGQPGSPGS
jgi:hypothetical protein